jgi:hypothetical protein
MIGAAHAAGAAVDFDGQTCGDMATHVVELIDGKVHAEIGAASAATLAG